MRFNYNLETLKHITNDLSKLTGIAISVLDSERNYLITASMGNDYCTVFQSLGSNHLLCRCSDDTIIEKCASTHRLETHVCHAGLCDAAMPIMKNDIILGYIVFGRIRCASSPKNSKYCSDNLADLYHKLPYFSDEQLDCLHDLLSHILFERAIEIEADSFIETVSNYIEAHLNEKLSIDLLCHELNVSRNFLYRSFHNYYGKTVNDYITERRIARASSLLKETTAPVYEIAESIGFENYTYFCKLFKKQTGLSATEYRLQHENMKKV